MYPISIRNLISGIVFFCSVGKEVEENLSHPCPFQTTEEQGGVELDFALSSGKALTVTGNHRCQENLHLFVWLDDESDDSPVTMVPSSTTSEQLHEFEAIQLSNVLDINEVQYSVDMQSSSETVIPPFGKRKVIYFPAPDCVVYIIPGNRGHGRAWEFYNTCQRSGQILVKLNFRRSDGEVQDLPERPLGTQNAVFSMIDTPVSWSARFRDRPDWQGSAILDDPEQTYNRRARALIMALVNISLPLIVAPDNQNVDSRQN